MENKDFRDRLRNHEVPANNEAWEMMQAILDTSEEVPEKKSKRRFFFWLWFTGLGIIIFTLIAFPELNPIKKVSENANKTTNESILIKTDAKEDITLKSNTSITNSNEINSEILKTDISIVEKNSDSEKDNKENNNTQKGSISNNFTNKNVNSDHLQKNLIAKSENAGKSTNRNNQTLNAKDADKTTKTSGQTFNTKKKKINTARELNQDATTLIKDQQQNKNIDIQSQSQNSQTSNDLLTQNALDDLNERGKIQATDEKTLIESKPILNNDNSGLKTDLDEEDKPLATEFITIEKLLNDENMNLLIYQNSTIQISPKKESRWNYYGQLGYALFNDNPGLIFGGGLQFEFDKLLYLETILSYAYGNQTGIAIGEPRTSEKQIDFGILLNLNLINSRKSRFAFDLGYGYSKYWGVRVINATTGTIDQRGSIDSHLQGGISYTYALNRNAKLSLKLGAISYDDAIIYSALKFYKKI